MDAFFAAVEECRHESLHGLPLVVGADPEEGRGRGVVSTANYRAREYGIHSAMPISTAWRLSETARREGKVPAVFLRTSFDLYRDTSQRVMAIIREYASLVEEASIDEAYFDLSFCAKLSLAQDTAKTLKAHIMAQERLTCSIGIGPNKLIAKIASDMHKPDGLIVVRQEEAEAFLDSLPIRKIPGIGPKGEAIFHKRGVTLVRDIKALSREDMETMMGKWGNALYEKVRGRDDTPLLESSEPKSIGEQETFAEDTLEPPFLFERLNAMCHSVHSRISAEGFNGFKTVAVTVRFADFETLSRARTLPAITDSLQTLKFEAMRRVMPFLDARENPKRKKIRLLGVRVEKLIS
ncbi:MAG: DNA polymerase IV [Parcubacteria group bacterium Greene0714_36]|nr:MAG: DNA polymerase IV [Parcubacteria group bacterium Greene0714_36]